MAALESSHIIVVLERIQADGTCVSWLGQQLRSCRRANRIVLVV
jgi:hypothetical protein